MEFEIKKAAVLGAGTMGPGIAQILAIAGLDVCLYDISLEALKKAREAVDTGVKTFVEQGILSAEKAPEVKASIRCSGDLVDAVGDADLILEAIVEKAEIKSDVYRQLDELLPEDTLIASNTSFLNIFELMPERRLPYTVIAHWYSPPAMVPLVEVCPNEETKPEVVTAVCEVLKRGGKTPVAMKKFIKGYIVNRLQMCLNQEVYYLLDNGYCTPEDIDYAIKASFAPRAMVLGIMEKTDFGGLNMTANNYRNKSYTMPPAVEIPKVLKEHLDKGETGVMAGKGYYDYTGLDLNELYAKRDEQLFRAYKLQMELLADPLHNVEK